ncbi:MAG TPA: hypothetical protein VE714_03495, partial [Gemmatimonadales bacterium]|nr:hypothetical protein [Gemmatimonadales bacterium]
MTLRWDAPDRDTLRRVLADATHFTAPVRTAFFRDVYFDTSAGDLRQRGARCRVRFAANGEQWLRFSALDASPEEARLRERDTARALTGDSPPARALRAFIDPARLIPWLEREIERSCRVFRASLLAVPLGDLMTDAITARRGELTARMYQVALRPRLWGRGAAGRLAADLERTFPLRSAIADPVVAAQAALDRVEGEALAADLRGEREVAVVAVEHGRIGLRRAGAELRLPITKGSGEEACRAALRALVGGGEGQLRLLGVVPRSGDRAPLEVWTARRLHRNSTPDSIQWFAPPELVARVGSPLLRDPATLAALTVAARSPLVPEWSGAPFGDVAGPASDPAAAEMDRASRVTLSELRVASPSEQSQDPARETPEQFLNPELSWLEFNARVLALAEDPTIPLAARLRFLAIFSSNLDQFAMTQIAALKQLALAGKNVRAAQGGGLRPQETLDAIAVRLHPQIARQYRTFHALAGNLGLVDWTELSDAERAALRARCAEEILPFVSPKALTRAPGHPFPLIGDRRISLLVAMRDEAKAPLHYAIVELSADLPRFVTICDAPLRRIATENLVRANLDLLYPGRVIAGAHVFRLTRSGDLQLDETTTANFLQAIEEELAGRQQRPVLRIELEAAMPQPLRDLLQRELRFEESKHDSTLSPADVYPADGPV